MQNDVHNVLGADFCSEQIADTNSFLLLLRHFFMLKDETGGE